jgi:hypothetical protein
MKRTQLAVLAAVFALGSSSLAAQQSKAAATTKASVQHDSLKTVKKSIKADKSARKAAKARGDTTTAKALKKQLKAEKKTKAALKSETSTTPPTKKP